MRTVKDKLLDNGVNEEMLDDLISIDGFCESIVGLTITQTPRLIYDYDKMVEEFAAENNTSAEEACDYICYNTIRALDYWNEPNAPIIIRSMDC